ncbi:MAG: T9SS type A sorting domain-containing protein [Porphyromonadaceae bacterium]|nr:T9SS type A sorting domain-containing protein [Porphyromonadaceae bacterium]
MNSNPDSHEIISITGQSIHKIQSPNALETINMNNFPDGVYIVKIINKENQVDSEKIIVRR